MLIAYILQYGFLNTLYLQATMGRVFMVLLWKVYVLRKRRYLITLLELVVPIFFFWFLISINNTIPNQDDQISNNSWQNHKPYSDFVYGNFKVAYTPSTAMTDEIMSIVISKIRGEGIILNLTLKLILVSAICSMHIHLIM